MDNGKLGDIVAPHKGFFSAEGLDVTVSPGGPNAQTAPPVLAGQAQAGQMGSAQVLAGYGEGLPITMFAATTLGYAYDPDDARAMAEAGSASSPAIWAWPRAATSARRASSR